MGNEKKISTSAFARKTSLSTKEVFSLLAGYSWIEKQDEGWQLTDLGKEMGGEYVSHPKYGKYIAWPESIVDKLGFNEEENEQSDQGVQAGRILSATVIGEKLNISAQRTNHIFSEMGWIEKGLKGWKLTEQGTKAGGIQKEHPKTGIPYVLWPESILENKSFSSLVRELEEGSKGEPDIVDNSAGNSTESGFRGKYKAELRTTDGHYVRSKAEMLIDNWLYMAEIVHAYERKLPVEEELYCDFYIPSGKVYIEYWGYENDAKYLARKEKKKEIYAKYGFKLIELVDKDIQNLDDILPRLLLKHGVESF